MWYFFAFLDKLILLNFQLCSDAHPRYVKNCLIVKKIRKIISKTPAKSYPFLVQFPMEIFHQSKELDYWSRNFEWKIPKKYAFNDPLTVSLKLSQQFAANVENWIRWLSSNNFVFFKTSCCCFLSARIVTAPFNVSLKKHDEFA